MTIGKMVADIEKIDFFMFSQATSNQQRATGDF